MKTLIAIDRSTGHGSWAFYKDTTLVSTGKFESELPRAPTWFTDVIAGLKAGGCEPRGLDAMLVGTGPGSFSGIRAVLAAMQGLSLPSGIPVLGLSSSAAMARAVAMRENVNCVAVTGDARRGQLWCAVYDITNGKISLHSTGAAPSHSSSDFALIPADELAKNIPNDALVISPEFERIKQAIEAVSAARNLGTASFVTAEDLTALYFSDLSAAIHDPLPIYLQPAVR